MNSVHDHPKADERRTPNVYRTVDDLALERGLSRQVVCRELRAGRIPSIRLGRRFVIPRAAAEEWLRNEAGNFADQCMTGSSQMIGASPAGADPGPMVTSSDFTADARKEATRAKARDEVARAVAVMFQPGDVVEIDGVYLPALDQFINALRGVTAVAQALGSNRLQAIARDTILPHPRDWERNPGNPRRNHWQSDPASGSLYEHLLKLRAVVATSMEGFEDGLTAVPTETLDEQPV